MHALAATGSSESGGFLAYLVLFALVTLGWAGIPGIGATVLGAATALASQGRLNITAVLVVAVIAVEVGGMTGYSVGVRWGRALLSHPGPFLARRQRVLTAGEAMYAKWGRLAVFFTPCMVSGIAKMKYSQFVVWNLLAGTTYVLSVGLTVYGAGKVTTGNHDLAGVGSLIAGVAVGVAAFLLGRRYYRRRKARRAGAPGTATPAPAAAEEEN
jgi:membrane protein DedA with SNARE-associated domain